MTKYNVVSGWNRGGTSALMSAVRQAGIPIIGFRYPFQYDLAFINTKDRKVSKEMKKMDGGVLRPIDDIRHANPTGFWEISSVCVDSGLQAEHQDIGIGGEVIKINFNTLSLSEPTLVNKVVVILRSPRSVLAHLWKTQKENVGVPKLKWIKATSLGMLHSAVVSLQWLQKHKKDWLLIYYEDLIENPKTELQKVCDFFGRGEPSFGARIIQKKYNRSKSLRESGKALTEVMAFYKGSEVFEQYNADELLSRLKKIDKEIGEIKKYAKKEKKLN